MSAAPAPAPRLRMVWPDPGRPAPMPACPDGYRLRTAADSDSAGIDRLMGAVYPDAWSAETHAVALVRMIPRGWFLVMAPDGSVAASAMALHNYSGDWPFTGDIGWVATSEDHRGRGLGALVTAAAVNRFIEAGYERIQLHTEHYRPAAIRLYLRLGFAPKPATEAAAALWRVVLRELGAPVPPELG